MTLPKLNLAILNDGPSVAETVQLSEVYLDDTLSESGQFLAARARSKRQV